MTEPAPIQYGMLKRIEYRDSQPTVAMDTSVIRVHFTGPEGEMWSHDLPNDRYVETSPALQFFAVHGIKPTDFDGTDMEFNQIIPIVPAPDDDGWALSSLVLQNGRQALRDTDWFNPEVEGTMDDSAPQGGGNNDNGCGGAGGRTDDAPTVEVTPDDDTGVNIHT